LQESARDIQVHTIGSSRSDSRHAPGKNDAMCRDRCCSGCTAGFVNAQPPALPASEVRKIFLPSAPMTIPRHSSGKSRRRSRSELPAHIRASEPRL
jgi:hypothetical protein